MPSCPRCHADSSPALAACSACGLHVAASALSSTTLVVPLRPAETQCPAWPAMRGLWNGEPRNMPDLAALPVCFAFKTKAMFVSTASPDGDYRFAAYAGGEWAKNSRLCIRISSLSF